MIDNNIVMIGCCPQTQKNVVKPIPWKVIKEDGDKVLLISKICVKPGIFDDKTNVWTDSYLRKWLNDNFINSVFIDKEKDMIIETHLDDVNIDDKIFLLSSEEVRSLIPNRAQRRRRGTMYGVCIGGSLASRYWLRSESASNNNEVIIVDHEGNIDRCPPSCKLGICPALWISSEAKAFLSNYTPDPFALDMTKMARLFCGLKQGSMTWCGQIVNLDMENIMDMNRDKMLVENDRNKKSVNAGGKNMGRQCKGGLYISKKLFIEVGGLVDSRNKIREINKTIDERCDKDGYIWYQDALRLYKELWESGKYYMYGYDTISEKLLDHIDDWIAVGLIRMEYT